MTRRKTGEWVYDDRFGAGGYTSAQVVRLAGVTPRQLDYWTRTELIAPSIKEASGSGSGRRWSREDIAFARLIRELIALGVDVNHVRSFARPLRLAIDTISERPYFVVTSTRAGAITRERLTDVVNAEASFVVLDLDEVCALDRERDTTGVGA